MGRSCIWWMGILVSILIVGVTATNLEGGTYAQTSEIIQFLRDGERAIRISQIKDVVLVLGVTGSGKSTFSQFVTGNDEHMEAVEQGVDTGEYVIRDKGNKVCTATTDSCTTVPDLIVDRRTQTPFYDCPGFADTRHVKHDMSVTYFIKKVISSAHSVKLVFTISYPSVRQGVDRQKFMLLVKNAVNMLKDVEKFKDSIALIVTKVDNQYIARRGKAIRVADENIINNIASFLEAVKSNLIGKLQTPLPNSEYALMANAVKFIEVLLSRSDNKYTRIGIFRRPDDAGRLESPMMLENRKHLEKILHQNLNFTECDSDDFGYTVSAESINRMHDMVDEINKKISADVESLAEEIEEGFLLQERDARDVENLYKKFHFGYEAVQNLTNVEKAGDPRDFLMKMRETAGFLEIDLPKNPVESIFHYDRFLKFVRTLSGIQTFKPLEWVESLTNVMKSFDDSQKWYHFLLNLQGALQKHDVQKTVSRNSSSLDELRDQIRIFKDDASSPIKETLKHFLVEVFKGDFGKVFNTIENVKLNSWKLKFLNDALDFQVFNLCHENKLVVFGNYVHMSDVARKKCNDAKFVEIFALSKIFIDSDFDRTGSKIQLSILAPSWDVIGSPRIILDGEPGRGYAEKARDGSWPGANGHDGQPGLPGGAAGNFIGFGRNCINCQFLRVSANGGKGGKGQDGGNGVDGKNGTRPTRANHYKNIFNIGVVTVSHEDKGNQGQAGGNGGRGGEGGRGGNGGKISIVMFDSEASLPQTFENEGNSGIPGQGGKGGSGGQSEHIVESNTYLFGLHAWSNGVVSYFLFSSLGGNSGSDLNSEGMKGPEPSVDLVNPSHPVNAYKAYSRENLDNSLSRLSLEEFLQQLETSKDARNLYDTLGLVHDLLCLENQYLKLHRRVPLLPYYKSLQTKIESFATDPPYSEITEQYRKVRAFLYLSTLSKICTIDHNLSNNLVINVKDFLGMLVRDVDVLLKDFMIAKQQNRQRYAFQKLISHNIAEANSFIKEEIAVESQEILAEVDEHIRALILETENLESITRKELKKLNEHMITRGISSVLKLASRALDFFGGAGLALEGVIGSTNLITETLALEDVKFPSSEILGSLPDIVENFFSSITGHIEDKIKLFVSQLFDVERILGVTPALNDTASVITEMREELSSMSVDPEEHLGTVDSKRSEIIGFLQDQKRSMHTVLEDGAALEKAIDAFDHSERILKLPEGVYHTLKESNVVQFRSGELDANEKIKHLESYEEKIYSVLIPLCVKIKQQFVILSGFGGRTHTSLDVGKWKVQNALSDINNLITGMTEGFQVQGPLLGTLDKLKFGLSAMIQVYDRIQDYHDQAALADYMSDMSSEKAKAIQVTDRELSDAMDELQVVLKTNLILADYEMAMSAFEQHVFPFAKAYMEEYDLPASLKSEKSTDLLSEAIYKINSIERKLIKNDLTIDNRLDNHFFPDISFTSNSINGPFYSWTYETSAREILQLLEGNEVVLHADITKGLAHNAVKFNEIGIRFHFSNEASQAVFDEVMDKFSVEMNHFGMSHYRCGKKFYVMMHDTHKIKHSVNGVDGSFHDFNGVYGKLTVNEPLLSPYTVWKVKLRNVSAGFDVLANFTSEVVDLTLEGRGTFVSRDVDRDVCSDHLDGFYKVDGTVDEVPNIDYRIDSNSTESPVVVVTRRRRNIETNEDEYVLKHPTVFDTNNFVIWLTGDSSQRMNAVNVKTPNLLNKITSK